MEHFYQNITGWFTFPRFYKEIVAKFPSGSCFVEVGTYQGKSLAYLIVEIINTGKNISVTAIDSFNGANGINESGLLNKFISNMASVRDKFTVIAGDSSGCASKFKDNTIDFVFIDADHSYENVKKDVLAWLPKVKKGGIIAGHDYPAYDELTRAVNEMFGDNVNKEYIGESCWFVNI